MAEPPGEKSVPETTKTLIGQWDEKNALSEDDVAQFTPVMAPTTMTANEPNNTMVDVPVASSSSPNLSTTTQRKVGLVKPDSVPLTTNMPHPMERHVTPPGADAWVKHKISLTPPTTPSIDPIVDIVKKLSGERSNHSTTRGNNNHNNNHTNLAVDDIVKTSPLESEAETYILRAIEQQEANRARTGSVASSTYFSNVPEDTDIFRPETSAMSHHSHHHKKEPKASAREEDTRSQSSAAGKVASLLPPTTRPRHVHKRTKTMEETLFSLTEAMNDLHGRGNSALLMDNEEPPIPDSTASGAVDSLAHNATLIYRGKDDVDARRAAARKKWGVVRATIQATSLAEAAAKSKKDDDHNPNNNNRKDNDDDDDDDVETGVPASPEWGDGEFDDDENSRTRKSGLDHAVVDVVDAGREFVTDARTFTKQRQSDLRTYMWTYGLIVLPAIGIAFVLFYFCDNPPTGKTTVNDTASVSWWILFVCVRQIVTLSMAKLLQVVIIDFLCLSTRKMVNFCGQLVTLLIVQSKGWPFLITAWAMLDLLLLQGNSDFAQHWAYWQSTLEIFTDKNPSGGIPDNDTYSGVLIALFSVGIVVAFKRLWLGFFLGRKIYRHYSEDLAKLIKKIILLSKVALLARDLARKARKDKSRKIVPSLKKFGLSREKYVGMIRYNSADNLQKEASISNSASDVPMGSNHDDSNLSQGRIIESHDPTQMLSQSEKMRINELLGTWEEPEKELGIEEKISIDSILQFRRSLSSIENEFLFSLAWGDVSTRERMIMSSQQVFERLNVQTPESNTLRFEILALAAVDEDGILDQEVLKDLIRLIRPDRDGNLSLLDFVKSVDTVYKEAKLLRASIRNSEKVDRAFENVINTIFYVIVGSVILSRLGIQPMALFLSMSSIILAFAFMIGSASSKMFEGWLFILLQRPYDIGDRVNISNVQQDTSASGSPGWIVKDVTLFSTTFIYGSTNERATIANSAMSGSRIINMARSPKAVLCVYLKFSTEVEYEKVEIFEQALRKFVRSRPREWANFIGFRPTQIMADLGYIEYITILQHRDSWQNVGALKVSLAEVSSFCLELSKKMDMRYKSPPLPVNLSMMHQDQPALDKLALLRDNSAEIQALSALFDSRKNK